MLLRSPAFQAYVAPARLRPQIWRLLAGLVLCLLIYVAWVFGLLGSLWWLSGTADPQAWLTPIIGAATPAGTLILLATFFGMALGPMLVVRLLHKRGAATLFGRGAIVIRHFVVAAGVVGAVYAISLVIWFMRFDAVPNLSWSLWLSLLPLALLGLLVQTGAEELLFRGYLQQQLAARFASPLIWMVLPSLAFGAAHYDPATAGGNVWLLIVAAGLFGLVAADLTAVSGSIGAAWGFHFANNVAAVLIIAVQGTMPGLALFTTPYAADDTGAMGGLVAIDLIVLAIVWAFVRRALRR